MTAPTQPTPFLRLLRSIAAVLAGFIAIVALSLGTDQVLHVLEIFPPWGQPMNDTSDNLLALAYRMFYGVVGSYLTARLAPYAPLGHALTGGAIGFVLSTLGVVAALNVNLGPIWYPIALAVSALPTAWLGGVLYRPAFRSK